MLHEACCLLNDVIILALQRACGGAGAGSAEGDRRKRGSGDENRAEASAGNVTRCGGDGRGLEQKVQKYWCWCQCTRDDMRQYFVYYCDDHSIKPKCVLMMIACTVIKLTCKCSKTLNSWVITVTHWCTKMSKSTFDFNLLQQIFHGRKVSDLTCNFLMTPVLQQHEHAELLVYPWS